MVLVESARPSALDLVVRQTSDRILARGEAYFRAGHVHDIVRRPGRARGRVRGSRAEAYRVSVRWSSGRVTASCDCPHDWSGPCKHAAALAYALEPSLPVADPPVAQADPVALAEAKERADRVRSAKSERFQLRAAPRGRLATLQVFSQRTRALYDVLVGANGFAWCSCADVRTSELGRCKHIDFVFTKWGRRVVPCDPVAVVVARDTRGRLHEPLADIFVHEATGALGRVVGADGFIDPALLGSGPGAAARLRGILDRSKVAVRAEVSELLDRLDKDERWAERFRAFEGRVRASLAGQAEAPLEWQRLASALRHPLHPYQIDGILFAARVRRAILGDDMGLGKTVQAVAAAYLLMQMGEVGRALIVCPASLKRQWASEIAKFLGDGAGAVVIEGGRREREDAYRRSRAAFVILNYELVIKDLAALRKLDAGLLIADEAQRIKNWNTKTAKSVKALPTPRVLVLTGTPLENRLAELHSVIELADARAAGPMWRLGPEFTATEDQGGRSRVVGFRGLDLVRRRLAPLFLRRERTVVASQLPERTDQVCPVAFTPEQAVCHAQHAANAARIAAKKHLTEVDILRLMAELTSMRLVANGLLLYEWGKVEAAIRSGRYDVRLLARYPSPKLAEVGYALESLLAQPGAKIVVFSQWERMLRLAAWATRATLERAGARALFFHGQMSAKERAEAVADFHADPAARVFFSTDAGGVGLNLQEAATAMIHLEVPWNPAVLEQRVGRIHRLGQKRPVHVVSLVTERCIETRIAQVVEQKRALFDGLFRGDSDELRFDDEARGPLVERMRRLLDGLESKATTTEERAAAAPAPVVPVPAPPPPPPPAPPPSASQTLDIGPLAQAALKLFGLEAGGPISLPIAVRRNEGRVSIDLPALPPSALGHLGSFLAALAAPPECG